MHNKFNLSELRVTGYFFSNWSITYLEASILCHAYIKKHKRKPNKKQTHAFQATRHIFVLLATCRLNVDSKKGRKSTTSSKTFIVQKLRLFHNYKGGTNTLRTSRRLIAKTVLTVKTTWAKKASNKTENIKYLIESSFIDFFTTTFVVRGFAKK